MCGKLNNFVDGAAFRQMVIEAAYAIETHKQELNDLNVFPVPDMKNRGPRFSVVPGG